MRLKLDSGPVKIHKPLDPQRLRHLQLANCRGQQEGWCAYDQRLRLALQDKGVGQRRRLDNFLLQFSILVTRGHLRTAWQQNVSAG